MSGTCRKCDGQLEAGFTTARGLMGGDKTEKVVPQLQFVVPGEQPSWNPIKAFQQRLSDAPSTRIYGIVGYRCLQCGALEFYAQGEGSN